MKVFYLSFFVLTLMGCSSSPLTLTPTQYSYSGKERTRQVDPENLPLEPSIRLREIQSSFWGRQAIIEVQGWYSSSGLRARKLGRIDMTQEIEENQLILTYYVAPKGGFGKEGNLIYGYNYHQTTRIKIPKEVKQLQVKLIEQNANKQEILTFKSTLSLVDE
ncbi:hypothetical protein [Myroides sp. DW712]|uniref:hypothetical protein n=1 Tax=Myroides sp. DW712 TaxID=3389800 RepID=UPI00397C7A04